MERYKVYHNKNFYSQLLAPMVSIQRDNLTYVADVDAESLAQVFEKTNHRDQPWQQNAGVQARVLRPRSTSIGDVIVDAAGQAWLVASVGFEAVTLV